VEIYCKENYIEACAVRLHLPAYGICIIAIYRAPSGNLQQYFQNLDELLITVSDHTEDIVICGDTNINYFRDSYHKQQLDSLLASHGLKV
jgi:exonuclease III